MFAAVTLAAPAVAAADAPTVTSTTTTPRMAAADEAVSYSQRETQEPQAAQFQGGMIESTAGGGTVVVISGVALAAFIVLALMLI